MVAPSPRRYPTRTCVACRTSRQKRDLVRVVRTPDGRIVLDGTGRLAGRGAYLCADGGCWRRALEQGRLQRAFGGPLPMELKEQLEAGALGVVLGADWLVAIKTAPADATSDDLSEGEAVGQE